MSTQLQQVFSKILKMPYYKNESQRSGKTIHGHEDALSLKLTDDGFVKLNNKDYPKLKKHMIKGWEDSGFDFNYLADKSDTKYKTKYNITFGDMPAGSYLTQPAGPQSFPDFLIKDFDGRFIAVEAKSGKKNEKQVQKSDNSTMAPMWNDNLPKTGAVYIYSNEKNNQTTVFLGRDVISDTVIKLQESLMEELNKSVERFRSLVREQDIHNRGWDIKYRPQNFQGYGLDKCDYFKHKDRKKCENNVLEFVK